MSGGAIPEKHPLLVALESLLARTGLSAPLMSGWMGRLRWLIAPDIFNFGYALRTTLAALIALGIALWWELGSPQWAPLTVWMIAQGSRGKSLAKARWHMFGMVVGTFVAIALVAATPQQPLMFILLLSAAIGILCFIGTLLPGPAAMTNYRMHGMRASGFTLTIIALDGSADPHHIFMIAASRATYITLGITCETVISSLFQFKLTERARDRLTENFIAAMDRVCHTLAALLQGKPDALNTSPEMMAAMAAMGDQIEFAEVEMGRHGHEGDHARAALAGVVNLFSCGLNLSALMRDPAAHGQRWQKIADRGSNFLLSLPDRLKNPSEFPNVMTDLAELRAATRVDAADCLALEMDMVTHPPVNTALEERVTREGQTIHVLGDMLDGLDASLTQFEESRNPPAHDRFRYGIQTWRDWHIATANCLRASVSMFLAGVIWITTAWPDGLVFMMFVGIVCSLFSTLETPAMASRAFFHGAVCVSAVALIITFWAVPAVTVYEMLAMVLVPPMMLGGLAFSNPRMILGAVAYNLFLTILIGPLNQGRTDEILFFNTAMPLCLAMAFCTWMYRTFLPLDPDGVRWNMRVQILQMLRGLAKKRYILMPRDVIGVSVERMVRLLNTVAGRRGPVIDAYLRGVLSGMTVGLAILNLRGILVRNELPPAAARDIQDMLGRMAQFTGRYGGHYGRTERATLMAVSALTHLEQHETNLSRRVEILRALASLQVIAEELAENRLFFDASSPYLDPVFS
ncbi:FUSC family protein [Acetobacter estunensis]|uniref:FUSC family protein n=1 Tax=Acetobacter estunensis TaxID=104097 RepID=UPI001C2D2239|nr:FUSC family protein [Acetobacter estunensis]MBV1838675.1 FUSC family protein [Acetobacter estunensis]